MHPFLRGPRYFFYPFIFLLWFWIDSLLSVEFHLARLVPAAALALMLHTTAAVFKRPHAHLEWSAAVRKLTQTGKATLPIEFDGNLAFAWSLPLVACGTTYCKAPE